MDASEASSFERRCSASALRVVSETFPLYSSKVSMKRLMWVPRYSWGSSTLMETDAMVDCVPFSGSMTVTG